MSLNFCGKTLQHFSWLKDSLARKGSLTDILNHHYYNNIHLLQLYFKVTSFYLDSCLAMKTMSTIKIFRPRSFFKIWITKS